MLRVLDMGGYETFLDRLTECHRENKEIQYHIACKANGVGSTDESILGDVEHLSENDYPNIRKAKYIMKIAVVLVTYNRIECLKKAISKYESQSLLPYCMIIVNNASNDGTCEYLDFWKNEQSNIKKIVIHNEKNLGGSGGFYTGLKASMDVEYDYVFLADDDAYPDAEMLNTLFGNTKIINDDSTAAICTAVINHGKIDVSHRCRIKKGALKLSLSWVPESEYSKGYFKLDIVTFVGAAIKRKIIEQIGMPIKDYFIYYDDTEYFMRISKVGNVYCIPESLMIHDTDAIQSINSWKGYYDTRNWIDAVKRHYGRYVHYVVLNMYIRRCSILAAILKKRSRSYRNMCIAAINDAKNGISGISEIYRPGYKID